MALKRASAARELIDAVDEHDRVVAQIERKDAPNLRANVRAVQVYIFDARGRLLIHELSVTKRYAGAWGASVAGGVKAGESPLEAARRELREEMGIRGAVLREIGKIRVRDDGIVKFISVFACGHKGALHPDPKEIARVEWAEPSRIREMMVKQERRFTPTFQSTFLACGRALIA